MVLMIRFGDSSTVTGAISMLNSVPEISFVRLEDGNSGIGICWAASVALAGYFGGAAAKRVIEDLGVYGLLIVPIGVITGYLVYRRHQRRVMDSLRAESQADAPQPAPAEPAPAEPPA
jgi:hypothetical protein